MAGDIDIRDPVAIFDDASKQTLGFVSYEGDLHGHLPLEMHFDTEERSLSVLFDNGDELPLCVDMSADDVAAVSELYKHLRGVVPEVVMGFYRVDAEANLAKPLYKVPVLMM